MSRVLLVAPSFFGYHLDIANEFELRGYQVDYIHDRPSESIAFKSLGRISYRIVQGQIESYYAEVREKIRDGSYDLVMFVGGMSISFTRTQFEGLRSASDATFGLYLWDTLANCQRVGSYTDLFDFVFSFEPNDCDGETIRFLPLFYVRAYEQVPVVPKDGFDYDACFIGSVHQVSKFKSVKRIADALEDAIDDVDAVHNELFGQGYGDIRTDLCL